MQVPPSAPAAAGRAPGGGGPRFAGAGGGSHLAPSGRPPHCSQGCAATCTGAARYSAAGSRGFRVSEGPESLSIKGIPTESSSPSLLVEILRMEIGRNTRSLSCRVRRWMMYRAPAEADGHLRILSFGSPPSPRGENTFHASLCHAIQKLSPPDLVL